MNAILVSQRADRKEYRLNEALAVLGRDAECDIVIEGSGVSRRHARIVVSDDEYLLEDLGSKNGTWVNRTRVINPVALTDGDSISIGDQSFSFHLLDAKTETAFMPRFPAAVAVVLFTDLVNSTGSRQRIGDERAQHVIRVHDEIVRAALASFGGSEIKHTGDGIMAAFTTASSGLECSIAIQRAVASHVEEYPEMPLAVYIGLNAGEPIVEDDDLFGTSVDLAARICDHAEPGQILASNVVRELAAGKGFIFGDIGEVVPKGFEEPVRLYEVKWREGA